LVEARRREARIPAPATETIDESVNAVIDAIQGMKETAGLG
jgi:hypothetical protein